MRVIDNPGQFHFPQKPGQGALLLAGALGGQHLEGHQDRAVVSLRFGTGVAREVDGAHAPPAERREYLIRTQDEPLMGSLCELDDLKMSQRSLADKPLSQGGSRPPGLLRRLGEQDVDLIAREQPTAAKRLQKLIEFDGRGNCRRHAGRIRHAAPGAKMPGLFRPVAVCGPGAKTPLST